jgi:hypothetical protein
VLIKRKERQVLNYRVIDVYYKIKDKGKIVSAGYWGGGAGGGGGRGEKWTKPCMHIWIIKEKWKK